MADNAYIGYICDMIKYKLTENKETFSFSVDLLLNIFYKIW